MTRINGVLSQLNTDFDTQSTATKKELLKIDTTIQEMISDYKSGKVLVKQNIINISNVSKKSGISRKTFYNNDILNKYIEIESVLTNDKTPDSEVVEKLKIKNTELRKRIEDILANSVIDAENIKCENDSLMEALESMQKQYNTLKEEYDRLSSEYEAMRRRELIRKQNVQNMPK